MKKAIVVAAIALSAFAVSTRAQLLPPKGYIGLYNSEAFGLHCWCPIGESAWGRIEMWVWCLPSTNGLKCAEFAVQYPARGILALEEVEYNTEFALRVGNLPSGVSACFADCQTAWVWFCRQTLWVRTTTKAEIELAPHPCCGEIRFASCAEGNPLESVMVISPFLGINWEPDAYCYACQEPLELMIGAGVPSWGAIKSLFE